MKISKNFILLALVLTLLGVTSAFAATSPPNDPGWPRVFKKSGKELTIHQPQIDSWQDYKNIHARSAIAVKDGKSKKVTYGIAEWDGETVVNQNARIVAVIPKKRELRFPNTSEAAAEALRRVVEEIRPFDQAITVSLDRILACLDPTQQPQQHAVDLNLDPPKIFFSSKPAILVMIQGEPKLQPVDASKNDLMFVVNTNWDIFYDATSQEYYLLNQESWLKTKDFVNGPWVSTTTLPKGMSSLPKSENWDDVRTRVPGKPEKLVPAVLISKEPAEMIHTQGDPTYTPISGTQLLRITNTESVVFLNSGKGFYFLTAGRWFHADDLVGPWTSASNSLPADFAMIPDNDPAAFVKATVPGTTEAKDAVLLASIPQTTSLEVNTPVKLQVAYNGQPKFQPIPSTSLQYAVNTTDAVFHVNGAYYCCAQGVWYSSNTANGPWVYCTNVPAAIYTIPPSHPTHNVTYVTVQSSTPSTVVYAQTAGYSGEYVAANGVLMFGAGMVMGAIIADSHNSYYPVPYSYGHGVRYNYVYGGYYRPPYPIYGPYRSGGVVAAYNPATGTYVRGAYMRGPAGSAAAVRAYNPYTGAAAAGARVDTAYGSAGRAAAYNPTTGTAVRGGYRSNANGTVAGVQTNKDTGAVAWDTKKSQGAVVKGKNDNVYAGKDGNVYKKDSDGNWTPIDKPPTQNTPQAHTQQRSNTSQTRQALAQQRSSAKETSRAQTQLQSSDKQDSPNTRNLEAQAQARSRGNQLSQNNRSSAPQFRAQQASRTKATGGEGGRRK